MADASQPGKLALAIIAILVLFGALLAGSGWLVLIMLGLLFFSLKDKIAFFKQFKINNMANPVEVNVDRLSEKMGGIGKAVKWIVIGLIGIWIFSSLIVIIDAGETGVYSLFGKVRDEELRSGFHLVNPLAKVTRMTIRTEQYTMSIAPTEGQKKGDDSISSLTKEGLDVNIDFTALYRLEESKASDIYREVGVSYVDKIIRPEIRGVIRDVVSQYEAKELYSEKRQEASSRIFNMLLERIGDRGIVIEEAVIRNVQLPASLTKAIQEKLAAEQEAQKYDFVLDREKKEAERKRIEAEGQRDAQKIIDESLSEQYLNYMYIKELKDRQGTIYVPVSPSSGMPLFKGIQ